jgi:beta-N-acetylhexosaminidase
MKRLAALLALLGVAAGVGGAATSPSIGEMVGQLLLVRMQGQTPSPSFLARVRRGEIGGVVLFSSNFGASSPRALVAKLQAAAKAGHQPPLFVAVDQEGGIVKRLPGAPTLAPPEMRTAAIATAQGLATARTLAAQGVNVDLAPVLDVGHGGFIASRTFGTTPALVSARGIAFAVGLARGHVLATAKHFPGLGHAVLSTDATDTRVTATAAQLKADWLPFKTAIGAGIPLVMMSTAVYPALGSSWPAALSPNIVADLRALGFKGVVVTDALQTPAVNTVMTTASAAVNAVAAGDDLVLAAGPSDDQADTDGASISAYNALVAAAESGRIDRRALASAYARVVSLKKRLQ